MQRESTQSEIRENYKTIKQSSYFLVNDLFGKDWMFSAQKNTELCPWILSLDTHCCTGGSSIPQYIKLVVNKTTAEVVALQEDPGDMSYTIIFCNMHWSPVALLILCLSMWHYINVSHRAPIT